MDESGRKKKRKISETESLFITDKEEINLRLDSKKRDIERKELKQKEYEIKREKKLKYRKTMDEIKKQLNKEYCEKQLEDPEIKLVYENVMKRFKKMLVKEIGQIYSSNVVLIYQANFEIKLTKDQKNTLKIWTKVVDVINGIHGDELNGWSFKSYYDDDMEMLEIGNKRFSDTFGLCAMKSSWMIKDEIRNIM